MRIRARRPLAVKPLSREDLERLLGQAREVADQRQVRITHLEASLALEKGKRQEAEEDLAKLTADQEVLAGELAKAQSEATQAAAAVRGLEAEKAARPPSRSRGASSKRASSA